MATQNQNPISSSLESILAVIEDDNVTSNTKPESDSVPAESCGSDDVTEVSPVKETKTGCAKSSGRKKPVPSPEADGTFATEFERCLQEFKGKPSDKYSSKVPIDNDIAETLRLIKGFELRAVVNATLKAMLLYHKEDIKKYFAPKPKYIV